MYRDASISDIEKLSEIFWDNLVSNPSYISHGEIQMGIATDVDTPAINGLDKWKIYIEKKIIENGSSVLLYEEDGKIEGFIVVEIDSDGDKPFGVICDLLTSPGIRRKGVGKALLKRGILWMEEQQVVDFYLESGINNHSAHEFFQHMGFKMVSHIFKSERH